MRVLDTIPGPPRLPRLFRAGLGAHWMEDGAAYAGLRDAAVALEHYEDVAAALVTRGRGAPAPVEAVGTGAADATSD